MVGRGDEENEGLIRREVDSEVYVFSLFYMYLEKNHI